MTLLALALGLSPGASAFDLHHVYVADGRMVRVLDPVTGLTDDTIVDGIIDAVDAKFRPDGARLYVVDNDQKTVEVFDAHHDHVDTFVASNLVGPRSVTVHPDGRLFVVDPLSARVVVFDEQGAVVASLQHPGLRLPFGATISRDGDALYVSTTERHVGVHVFDLTAFPPDYAGLLPDTPNLVQEARGLATGPAGDLFIVDRADAGARVHRYDPQTHQSNTFVGGLIVPTYIRAGADLVWITDPVPGPFTSGPTIQVYDYYGAQIDGIGDDADDPGGLDEYQGSQVRPTLTITGTCPGPLSVSIVDLTPDGRVAIIGGSGIGGEYITGGSCAGTQTGLTGIRLLGGGLSTANVDGEIHLSPTAGAGACGTPVQVLDVATCTLSNVDAI